MIESSELCKIISSHLDNKTALSVCRIGDGEAIILNSYNDLQALHSVYKRQLGETPSLEGHEEIRNGLIRAYDDANIIGVPTERAAHKKGYFGRAHEMLRKYTKVGDDDMVELEVIHKDGNATNYGRIDAGYNKLTSIDFHSHFLDNNYWNELLQDREHLCYISCRNLDDQLKNRYNIKNVWSYIIAPEMKFTSGYEGLKHYPDQYHKIKRWITKIPVQGNLCLFGAGVVGKVYGAWFKEEGGIAIDVGSVFDSWAGLVTRGAGRGLDKEDETHKL